METQYEVRREFLKEFARQLIFNTSVLRNKSVDSISQDVNKDALSLNITVEKESKEEKSLPKNLKISPPQIKLPYGLMQKPGIMRRLLIKNKPYIAPRKIAQLPPTILPLKSLSKLESVLRDPLVSSIECLGKDIPLNVVGGGFSKSTPIRLSAEEIESILLELSQKTKIPRIPGSIFKAAIGNIIVTSLNSGYLGNRFIIQKKS